MEVKKSVKEKSKSVYDGLVNAFSGLGTRRDRVKTSEFKSEINRNYPEWEALYSEEGLARKAVEIIPNDMIREWRVFTDKELDEKEIERISKLERRFAYNDVIRSAMYWARLYGGAGIIPVLHGNPDYSKPFNPSLMSKGRLKRFTVVDAVNLRPITTGTVDPFNDNFMNPPIYTVTGVNSRIHRSWIKRVDGVKLPQNLLQRNDYWHESVLENVKRILKTAISMSTDTGQLFGEQNLDILSIENLNNIMAQGGEESIKKRFEIFAEMKSLYKLILTDSTEQFLNRTISMSGVEGVLGQAYSLVAGSLDIPVTRFLGTSAKGLNATGEGDIRNYYDNIGSRQDSDLRPVLDWMDAWVQMNEGKEPEMLMYEFPALWQESDAEKEVRLNARADRDLKYLTAGVVDESHILKELVSDKVYSFVDQDYVDAFTEALDVADLEEDPEKD